MQYTESSSGTDQSQNVSLLTLDNVGAVQRNGQVDYLVTDYTLSGDFSVDFAGLLQSSPI